MKIDLLVLILIISIGVVFVLYLRESKEKMQHHWDLEKLVISEEELQGQFKRQPNLSFLPRNLLFLPQHDSFRYQNTVMPSIWHFERKDFINGIIRIEDKNQNIFSGVYAIEILSFMEPWAVKIYNDSIQIYLTRTQKFKVPPRKNENPLFFLIE